MLATRVGRGTRVACREKTAQLESRADGWNVKVHEALASSGCFLRLVIRLSTIRVGD